MNNIFHKQMVQEALSKKFGSHQVLLSKHRPAYPAQVEREYQRVTNAYIRILNKVLAEYLPEVRDAADMAMNKDSRFDDDLDLIAKVTEIFNRMAEDLERRVEDFGLLSKIQAMTVLAHKLSIREWKKQVKSTLGIDLMEDYYSGEMYREMMEKWVEDNVALIKTIPQDSLGRMRKLVMEGYRNGKTTASIIKEIQHQYSVDRRHAQLLARDQIAKLNGNITKRQQEDAGVQEYIWSTSEDSRVRPSHAALNGKRFRWDDPPVVDLKTGRRCHPGEDYECRCVALAVFDWDTVDLPMTEGGG